MLNQGDASKVATLLFACGLTPSVLTWLLSTCAAVDVGTSQKALKSCKCCLYEVMSFNVLCCRVAIPKHRVLAVLRHIEALVTPDDSSTVSQMTVLWHAGGGRGARAWEACRRHAG